MVVSMRNWFGAARLPRAFARAGFEVVSLAYPNMLLGRSRYLSGQSYLPDSGEDEELLGVARAALVTQRPVIVVPTDDASVELLQAVAASAKRELPESDPLLVLLRNSVGDFSKHAILRQRHGLARLAEDLGVRAPAHAVVRDAAEARAFSARHGLPVVLKAEASLAGMGVAICKDEAALDNAVQRFADEKAMADGAVLQTYVTGRTAMRAVMAFRGRVLGGLSAIKVETHPAPTGPSAVVQFIENTEMLQTAQKMIGALGYSGFASLDFILDDAGAAHLIELNSRPTPICHLGEHLGLDLCRSFRRALEGELDADRDPANLPKKVALFPQEWVRNQSSPHFDDAFHDVPWDEPDLVEGFITLARGQMRWRQYDVQEKRRERLRELLTRLDAASS
jgi:predicted ATP-grasp superfamily ATP-dependent carboligase